VVHLAGAVRGSGPADFDRVNVDGTARLLAAISEQPSPPRLLLVSSLAAREPDLSWYAASKRAAEDLLQDQRQLDWTILRPPAVYGPGDREMLPVFRAMARGIAPVPGDTRARISLIHVADLVTAIIRCLASGNTRHQTLSLCDGREAGYDWQAMADLVAAIWQRRVRLWQVPHWLLDAVAWSNLASARLTRRAPMLTPAKLRELRHPDWVVDNQAITAATGWTPEIDLRKGLEALHKAEI
jgi:nucleoside-diphosphate-sugar epimerase